MKTFSFSLLLIALAGCADATSCTFVTVPKTYEETSRKCPPNLVIVEVTNTGVICADVQVSCPVKGGG